MTKLITLEKEGMTSLEIAEITGKQHVHIMRDIRDEINKLGENIGLSIFGLSSYKNSQNKEQPMYNCTPDGVMQLAARYDAVVRYKLIQKVKEIQKSSQKLPQTYLEALKELVKVEEEKQQLEHRVNSLVHSKKLYTTTEIAKELGFKSAISFNKKLEEDKIQYKCNNTWVLCSKYADKDYTSIKQTELDNGTVIFDRKWTGLGRDFLLGKYIECNE
jgi:Rha family phage regulatory protein